MILGNADFDTMSYQQVEETLNAPEVVNASGIDVVLLKIKLLKYLTGGYDTIDEFVGAIAHNSYTITNEASMVLEYFLKIMTAPNKEKADNNLLFLSNALLNYRTTFGNDLGSADSECSDYIEKADFSYLSTFDRAKEINTLINKDFVLDTFTLDVLRTMVLIYRTTTLTKYLK